MRNAAAPDGPRIGPPPPRYHRGVTAMRTLALLPIVLAGPVIVAANVSVAMSAVAQTQAQPAAPTAVADMFPEGTGKPALLRVCSNCHGADTIVQTLRTRQEWSDVIDQMARFGAEASDQDFEQILGYLVKFYSPIRVNRATAKELENTLDIPAAAAEAIVAFRQEKGAFKAIEDLKAVPGLDWPKIEARQGRLVFTT
jgi:competence protein ComEA